MNDLLPIAPLPGAAFVQGDFLDSQVRMAIAAEARSAAISAGMPLTPIDSEVVDLVLSDMAPNTTGDGETNHLQQIELAFQAFETAGPLLRPSGAFLCKIFSGSEDAELAKEFKLFFKEFKRIKPKACRSESRELYFFGRTKR
jgi:23S rRNA U2552 (ribose-2'-O)-methylase RlmE/FtsJ